ncbi:MAG TPA: CvpA family protein [Candidatus Polarisedimenticolia bacterium]|nr:CvpA family protein [Candidatus Polarisedimenticolia bacterium]
MNLPFNWFDIAIICVLALGLQRGRKHGMSEELMLVMKWLAMIVACGLGYSVIGDVIADNTVFTKLAAYLMAYIVIALGISVAFLVIKKMTHGKLVGSDVFGSGEYYLGMIAGMVRYACILIFACAFLNAPLYTKSQIADDLKYQNDVYGSDFFPKLYSVQEDVFENSFVGAHIHNELGFLLIKSTARETKQVRKERDAVAPY